MLLSSQTVTVDGNPVNLTPKEYTLLLQLMRNKNTVLSREQLLVKCWGYDYEGEARAVDTHIRRLREKLGSVTIIHGKGTGALRKAVHDLLKKTKTVKSFRLGHYGEGEAGVTVVEFK